MSPFPFPMGFVVELTARCPHACLHCYNVWKNPGIPVPGEMRLDQWINLLDRLLDESGASRITLTGGEPLLHPDLFDLVDHLAKRGIAVDLITGGTLLTEAALDRLTPDLVETFEVPLLSTDRAVHDRLSGWPGAFDLATTAIAELKARRHHVVAVLVTTRENAHDTAAVVKLAFALGVDSLMLNRFNPGGEGARHIEQLQLSPPALQVVLDEAEAASAEIDLPVLCAVPIHPCLVDTTRYKRLVFGRCALGTEGAYYTIDPSGRVRPCNHSATVIGDLRVQGIAEVLAGEPLRAYVEALPSICGGCTEAETCRGGCKASAEVCAGTPDGIDPFLRYYAR